MKLARWLLGAILCSTLAAPAAAQRPEVVELRFRGNDAFSRAELTSAIVTQPPECRNQLYRPLCWFGLLRETYLLEPGALEADVFRLKVYYYERGYREAQISADTATVADDEVRVTFTIEEGRPVRVADVSIDGLPDRISSGSLPLERNEPFDVVAYEATRDTLQRRLWNNGYANGQVLVGYTIDRETPYRAAVRYDVYPGSVAYFGRIDVQGTERVSPQLVHRMLTFEEGGRYRRNALLQSQRNLYGLQIFRYADIQADMDAEPDTIIPVTIRVAEGNMHRIRLGAGANNIECAIVEGEWTSRNFLGNGRRLTVRGRLGNLFIDECGFLVSDEFRDYEFLTGRFSVDFSQPWLFSPRNSIGFGVFAERRNVPQVFVRSALGAYVSLSRSLGRGAAITLAYRPEITELSRASELFFCVNFVACSFEQVGVLQEPHWLAPVTLSLTVDRTNALFSPSEGYVLRMDLEHAAAFTGSEFSYSRILLESSQYVGEQEGLVLATRVRGGLGIPHETGLSAALGLNPQKRFFAGGANSVRGYDQYRLGPTVLGVDAVPYLVNGDNPATDGLGANEGVGCTVVQVNSGTCDVNGLPDQRFDVRPSGGEVLLEGNIELRFPLPVLGGSLRGAVFVDAGQVWRTREAVQLDEIAATPGLGLRYQSPIGPIRVDAAFNTQGPETLTALTTEVARCMLGDSGCRRTQFREDMKATLRNTDNVIPLAQPVRFRTDYDRIRGLSDVLQRIQLHFSIGQAF
ncbi:MAG: BamA/OMP85 family outer membrane protein [Candidatus Longimicrobiales bacterium M2_2A_002]